MLVIPVAVCDQFGGRSGSKGGHLLRTAPPHYSPAWRGTRASGIFLDIYATDIVARLDCHQARRGPGLVLVHDRNIGAAKPFKRAHGRSIVRKSARRQKNDRQYRNCATVFHFVHLSPNFYVLISKTLECELGCMKEERKFLTIL
jgi:hypothetical protein